MAMVDPEGDFMIKFEDFTQEYVGNHPVAFYLYTDGDIQICLEPCMSGMCVSIYDSQNWILAPKLCTEMPGYPKQVIRDKAVALANILHNDYKAKHVIE